MTQLLPSMGDDLRVIIVGSAGGIGSAFIDVLYASDQVSEIYALSRHGQCVPSSKITNLTFDITNESSIKSVAETLQKTGAFDLCIITTGLR